ncbi:MAG: hypothetical protein LBQ70_03675 [Prevotellaceae bacterium]|jgi:hypothetical protein|nr:hypothetical protein [Prevotellaceae bacterium]
MMKWFSLCIVFLGGLYASPLLTGQSEYADSLSNVSVATDTVISEDIIETPELQVEKTPESVSPATLTIPPNMLEIRQPFMTHPGFWGYGIDMFGLTTPQFNPREINLNLNFAPRKNILELIRENPFRAVVYGAAMLAGQMNHTLYGEDKMTKIRLDNMLQSHSGIPETATPGSAASFNYEIDINKHK